MKTFGKLPQLPNCLLLGVSPDIVFVLLVITTQMSSMLSRAQNFHFLPIFRRFSLGWSIRRRGFDYEETSSKDDEDKRCQSSLFQAQFEALEQATKHLYFSLKNIFAWICMILSLDCAERLTFGFTFLYQA